MKVLIVSDSHGSNEIIRNVLNKISPIDCFIHLGDVLRSENELIKLAGSPVHMVSGNNDFFSTLPSEDIFMLDKYRVFITHGHRHHVLYGTERIKKAARSKKADIVMFGHTHVPLLEYEADLVTLNPGSISLPRQPGYQKTYIIMEIDRYGQAHFTINKCK